MAETTVKDAGTTEAEDDNIRSAHDPLHLGNASPEYGTARASKKPGVVWSSELGILPLLAPHVLTKSGIFRRSLGQLP